MDKSINSINADNSINSKETNISLSSENQNQLNQDIQNKIIQSIVTSLQKIINGNIQNIPNFIEKLKKKKNKDIFFNVIPNISLEQYINRLILYTKMEISTLIISIIYIDRFCYKNNYDLSYYNIYRLLLTSCLLSIKFNEDIKFDMKIYSDIAGVPIILLKQLEEIMFFCIDYRLYVNEEDYKSYYSFFLKTSNN